MPFSDHALARRLAQQAGELLVGLLSDPAVGRGWHLEMAGDLKAHEFLTAELRLHRPDDMVLSEEGDDDRRRLGARRVWIVDPLDGSSNFGISGAWSVHVALCEDGSPTAGAVAVPAWNTTYCSDPPSRPTMCRVGRRRVVVARSRRHSDGRRLAAGLDAEVVAMGSAGVKAMAVVRGEMDAYVHGGQLYEWDACAPVAVALAAGLHASDVNGEPLSFNNPYPISSGLVISRPEFADKLINTLARAHC